MRQLCTRHAALSCATHGEELHASCMCIWLCLYGHISSQSLLMMAGTLMLHCWWTQHRPVALQVTCELCNETYQFTEEAVLEVANT